MRLGLVFGGLGLVWASFAIRAGGAWLALAWPAATFLVVAAGYLGLGAGVLGKRSDGRRSTLRTVFFLPYFLVVHAGRALIRVVWREAAFDEVSPGLFVGRRCPPARLPPDVTMVVDLTAELDVPAGLPADGIAYRCLPTLDGHAPPLDALATLVDEVAELDGPIYVHCAAGHGRSAMVAAALLVRRGLARDVDEAERAMQRARPRIRLAGAQRRLLHRMTAGAGAD